MESLSNNSSYSEEDTLYNTFPWRRMRSLSNSSADSEEDTIYDRPPGSPRIYIPGTLFPSGVTINPASQSALATYSRTEVIEAPLPLSFTLTVQRTDKERKRYLKSLTDEELLEIASHHRWSQPSLTPQQLAAAIWKEAQADPTKVALAINKKLYKITSNVADMFKLVMEYDTTPEPSLVDDRGGELSPNTLRYRTDLLNDRRDGYASFMNTINNNPIYWPLLHDNTIIKMPGYALLDYIEVLLFAYSRPGKSEEFFLQGIAKALGVYKLSHRQLVKYVYRIVDGSSQPQYDSVLNETHIVSNSLTVKQLHELYNLVRTCFNAKGKLASRTKDSYLKYLHGNSNIVLQR